jgi:hypothetical protein
MQKFRVALGYRNALLVRCSGKVLQFGLEDAISAASPLAFPPLGTGLGEKCGTPYALLAASAHCRSLEV